MNRRIAFCALLATAFFLAPGIADARWMDPDNGRFQTMDTYEGDQEEPQSLHKYLYAANNPVNMIDPSGHDFELGSLLTATSIANSIQASYLVYVAAGTTKALHDIKQIHGSVVLRNLATGAYFGIATTSDYRKTFLDAFPQVLPAEVEVHHAVEQQVLKLYPGVVTKGEINSLENLRGIPRRLLGPDGKSLHGGIIRRLWNEFYRTHPTVTKVELLEFASEIDKIYGYLFKPPIVLL